MRLNAKNIAHWNIWISLATAAHSFVFCASLSFCPLASAVSFPSLCCPCPPAHSCYIPHPSSRLATQNTQTMTRRALSVSASTSTIPWPATAGSSAPQLAPMASPVPWGRWTSTPSSHPQRWSHWTQSTSRQAPGSSVPLGPLILTGMRVWSSPAPLSLSARRKVRTEQWTAISMSYIASVQEEEINRALARCCNEKQKGFVLRASRMFRNSVSEWTGPTVRYSCTTNTFEEKYAWFTEKQAAFWSNFFLPSLHFSAV